MLQYYYTWGDENILVSRIKIVKGFMDDNNMIDDDIYTITFEQESYNTKLFSDIDVTNIVTLISKEVKDIEDKVSATITRLITLKIKAICNPKPENIFTIVDRL